MWNDVFIHDISGGGGHPVSLENARTAANLLKELGLSEDVRIIGGGIEAPLKEWVSLPPAELQGKYAILEREDWMAVWPAGGVEPLNPKQLRMPNETSIPFMKASLPFKIGGDLQDPLVIASFNDGRVGWRYGDNHMELLRAAGFSRSDTSAWGMHMPDKRTWAFGGAREGIERMLKFMETNNRADVVVRITLEDSVSDNFLFAGKLSDYWNWAAKTQLPPDPLGLGAAGRGLVCGRRTGGSGGCVLGCLHVFLVVLCCWWVRRGSGQEEGLTVAGGWLGGGLSLGCWAPESIHRI